MNILILIIAASALFAYHLYLSDSSFFESQDKEQQP